jgi:peptidoglycan/LPS O-acetylase OafA/YrhL
MTKTDPATQAADRARQKAVRGASQPFFAIGLACLILAIGLGSWSLLARNAADTVLAVPFLICIGALSHAVAGIRSARWIRKHPLDGQG